MLVAERSDTRPLRILGAAVLDLERFSAARVRETGRRRSPSPPRRIGPTADYETACSTVSTVGSPR